MQYGQNDEESEITQYLDNRIDGGIKQKNLDKILDIIDDFIDLVESVNEG